MKPGFYIGIKPTNEVPKSCVYKELSYVGYNAGRKVEYFHVWVKEDNEFGITFPEDDLLNMDTLYKLDYIFNNTKKLKYK